MLQDIRAVPVTGGALLAGAAYAALSLFVTGPLVAERIIEKSGWPARCTRQSLAEATPETRPSLPSLDCGAVLGLVYGKDGEAFCARYGDALSLPFDLLGSVRRPHRDADHASAAQQDAFGSRCACAVRTVLDDRRLDFALHAGTARLVTPLAVRALDAELSRAARAPACSRGEAAR